MKITHFYKTLCFADIHWEKKIESSVFHLTAHNNQPLALK